MEHLSVYILVALIFHVILCGEKGEEKLPIYIPTNNVGGFSFFFSILTPSLQQTGIACSHSRTWAECGHCGKRHQWVRVFTPPPPAGPLLPLLRAVQIEGSTRNKATVTVTRSLTHSFSIY